MNLGKGLLLALSVLALLFSFSPGLAAVVVLDLGTPEVVTAFGDSVQVAIYALEGMTIEDIDSLVGGRARLELKRAADAAIQEYSAAICCLPEAPEWEAILQDAVPTVKAVGPGITYFQATANLVEYGALCAEEATLCVIVWAPLEEGQGDPAGSIESGRLLYDVE